MKTSLEACVKFADSLRSAAALRDCTYEIKSPKGYWLTYDGSGDRIKSGEDPDYDEETAEAPPPVSPPTKTDDCPFPPGSGERLAWLKAWYETNPFPTGGVDEDVEDVPAPMGDDYSPFTGDCIPLANSGRWEIAEVNPHFAAHSTGLSHRS